jgi:EAL domain-containing protein (putative c-di-GMP-specific phosphodiesterase class I)/methylmalonyl-CoA mutase cobalamin-binding subunit
VTPLQDPDARVLVVDNELINVTVLTKLLKRAGIEAVEGLTNSAQVMARIAAFQPDVVLLDLHMPAPDGYEVLRLIREAGGDTYLPVVVVTADITEEAKERALDLGAADFLTKPFPVTETLLRVRNLVHARRLHQALAQHNLRLESELEGRAEERRHRAERVRRVTAVVADVDHQLAMVFQPIVAIDGGRTVGYESLSRFSALPLRTPDLWFADAEEAGLGLELELAAVGRAIAEGQLRAGTFLSVNISPASIQSPAFAALIAECPPGSIVVELTEHAHIDDYAPIIDVLTALRREGVRLAVDDTGAGFASLHHILKLEPEFIKLDRVLVTDIDSDPARAALASALVTFADKTGAQLIAEGIETAGELAALVDLGVHLGQGYFLGRPGAIDTADLATSSGGMSASGAVTAIPVSSAG